MYKVKVISQKSINHLTADLSAAQAQMGFFYVLWARLSPADAVCEVTVQDM